MAHLKKGILIASCQAVKGEPLYGYNIMHLMAKACVEGGAEAIRSSSVTDINMIKATVNVPVIGIIKEKYDDSEIFITPTIREVRALLFGTDCEIIALDATDRVRPNGEKLDDLVEFIRKNKPEVEIMADVSTIEEAIHADELGFDYVGCTLRGYTSYTKNISIPDYDMISQMTDKLKAKVIAEGGIWETTQLEKVLACGVHAVVIGSSITRPKDITKRYVSVMKKAL